MKNTVVTFKEAKTKGEKLTMLQSGGGFRGQCSAWL